MSATRRRAPRSSLSAALRRIEAARQAGLRAAARRRAPASAALINAVLERADLRDDLGGGRVMLRLSATALADEGLRRRLGDEIDRAADVAVVWDEREDEIFRVFDGAAPPLALVASQTDPDPVFEAEEAAYDFDAEEEPQFVLTPAALQYLADSGSRRRW